MRTERVDVAIVGFGPVGAVLAILLGQLGRTVAVLERWSEPYGVPRAVHFDHEVARILQACGFGDELSGISEPADIYEWRNGAGQTLLRFRSEGIGASGWPNASMFNQPALEGLLENRARSLDTVEVRRGVEVTGIDVATDAVTVRGSDPSGDTVEVEARYVVGCDGANSAVRELLGVAMQDCGYFHDWLVVDVIPHAARTFDPINLQICDPARPTTAVSGGPGRRRFEFMRLPQERLEDLDNDDTAWRLLEPWDLGPNTAKLERRAVYTFQARWAEDWRKGRVLLAGDAAHQMPPFAGQGMCAGLRDAANLAWKVDAVLGGQSSEHLLDTYQDERLPHVQTMIGFSMDLGKVICIPDDAAAAERDAAMIGADDSAVPDSVGHTTGFLHPSAVHAGALFPQGRTNVAGHVRLLDDTVGTGWRLVTRDGAAALDGDLGEWFAGIGGRVVTIGGCSGHPDVDGTYQAWFDSRAVSVALQRPDFYLYGASPDPRAGSALVEQLRDVLADPTRRRAHPDGGAPVPTNGASDA